MPGNRGSRRNSNAAAVEAPALEGARTLCHLMLRLPDHRRCAGKHRGAREGRMVCIAVWLPRGSRGVLCRHVHAVRNSWRHKTNFDGRQSVPAVYVLPMPGDDVQRTARKERLAARIQPPGTSGPQPYPVSIYLLLCCLQEEPLNDCLCWCFCPLCAICQEKRELAARGMNSWEDFQRAPQLYKPKSRRGSRASTRKSQKERKSDGAALAATGAPGAAYEAPGEAQ